MIRTLAVTQTNQLQTDLSIEELVRGDFLWYWIDFHQPTTEEIEFLRTPLSFHPLAIEDCIHNLQRPKLDYYEDYTFFVTQALNQQMFTREEINFFLSKNYIITFHHQLSPEIDE